MKVEEQKQMCQCRKCGSVFNQKDAKLHSCPECGSTNYGLMDYFDKTSIEGVYKTFDFFRKK